MFHRLDWSCWTFFCSLSFCVSANLTTMGEEQPSIVLDWCIAPIAVVACCRLEKVTKAQPKSKTKYFTKEREMLDNFSQSTYLHHIKRPLDSLTGPVAMTFWNSTTWQFYAGFSLIALRSYSCMRWYDSWLTLTDPVSVSQNSAFLYGAKRVEHCPDIILIVFLGHHANEKFPLVSVLCVRWFHLYGVMHLKSSRKTVVAEWGLGDLW